VGNQALGKTTVALSDLLACALGEHPFRESGREKSATYWLICASWAQSIAIQGKLYDLIPPSRLHPETVFTSARGFRGKHQSVQVRHRDGTYSQIRFKTTKQGTLDLAGATVDGGVLFDEPPASQAVYSEVSKRTLATGAWVSIAMTPVGAPVDWIADLAAEGLLEDIHTPLDPEQLVPVGHTRPRILGDGTVCDAEWIAEIIRQTPAHEVPVRVHGEFQMRVVDRMFDAFVSSGPKSHVHDRVPTTDCRVLLGIDHGSKASGKTGSKQIATLILVDESAWQGEGEGHSKVYVLDEFSPGEQSTPEIDAKGILAMLSKHGLAWSDIDEAWGDRVHMAHRPSQRKSNKDLMVQIARQLGTTRPALSPQIRTVKRGTGRGRGSVDVGVRYLHHQMVRSGGFGVHPRCTRVIEALDRWAGLDDNFKDACDSLRYALDSYAFGVRGPGMRRGNSRGLRLR
jgi:phage terminase large subunit-like protein